jgi:hypothetical protein
MSIAIFIYAFLLFFVLTPGILLSLPPKGSKMVVAAVHALVFAIVWILTSKYVWMAGAGLEGYHHRPGNHKNHKYDKYGKK